MFALIPDYLFWHYRYGGKDVRNFSKNIIWFLWNFFSISLLLRTLFVPWQRLDEHGQKGNLQSYFEAFIITTVMRIVGAGIRLVFIAIGLVVIVVALIALIALSIVWFIVPFILLGAFITGFIFLFI